MANSINKILADIRMEQIESQVDFEYEQMLQEELAYYNEELLMNQYYDQDAIAYVK